MAPPDRQESRGTLGSFARFLVVGGLSYLVDVGILVLLHSGLDWRLATATTGAFAGGFVFTFSLNRWWVFRAGAGAPSGQAARYLLLVGLNYVATLVIVLGLAEVGVAVVAAKTFAVAAIAVSNFFLYQRFVFRTEPPDTALRTQQANAARPGEEES